MSLYLLKYKKSIICLFFLLCLGFILTPNDMDVAVQKWYWGVTIPSCYNSIHITILSSRYIIDIW